MNLHSNKGIVRAAWAKTLIILLSGIGAVPNTSATVQKPQWNSVSVPNVGRASFVVARPSGPGPFPTVILFHGSHGFAAEYIELGRELARGGVLAVAVCWFSPGVGEGRRFVTSVGCPQGTPTIPQADSEQTFTTIDSVVAAVRAMPESSDRWIALFGHSRGAGAVRNYVLRGGGVEAAILNSGGYPASPDLSHLKASVLILHGTADGPADGGSEYTEIGRVKDFEASLRAAHKSVEAHYYQGGTHNGLFASRVQRKDAVGRILQFMRQHFYE